MKNKVICGIIFFILLLISMYNILFFMRFDILTEHDLGYLWNRNFLYPEHGRYLATFLGSIVTQYIPEFLNIHTNDFQPVFASLFKGFFVILMCISIAYSGFIFSKRKIFIFSPPPAFLLTYTVVFLLLFNCFFFFQNRQFEIYFNILENTVFFEYPLSILWYTILMSGLYFLLFKNNENDNTSKFNLTFYIFICISAFLLGISVEIVNLPSFLAFSLFLIVILIKRKTKNYPLKQYLGIYFSFVINQEV